MARLTLAESLPADYSAPPRASVGTVTSVELEQLEDRDTDAGRHYLVSEFANWQPAEHAIDKNVLSESLTSRNRVRWVR